MSWTSKTRDRPRPFMVARPFSWIAATLLLGLVVLLGCRTKEPESEGPNLETGAESSPPKVDGPALFSDATEAAGVDFRYEPGPLPKYFFPAIMGGGGALFDFDNDGDLDIYLVNGNREQSTDAVDSQDANRLLEQFEPGRFRDITEGSGADDRGYGMGVATGDINNDGYLDLYVTNFGADQLYLNRPDGGFENITESAGIDNLRWAASATFFDYDRDGWLDLYVTNYVNYFDSRECRTRSGVLDFCGPSAFPPTVDKLYRNLGATSGGKVRFEDVTAASGIAGRRGPGLGVVSGDFNNDQWPDLYVANDGGANFLWINQQDGTFADEAVYRGAAFDRQGRAQAGMGLALSDVNQDGRSDLFVTHLGGESNALYLSAETGDYEEDSVRCGLGVDSYRLTGFGVAFVDIEHDGDEDVVIANGRVTKPPLNVEARGHDVYAEQNQILMSEDKCRFVSHHSSKDGFLARSEISRGLSVGDVDNDGDLDLLVVNIAGVARLHLNEAEKKGRWLMLRVREQSALGGRDALGAVVRLTGEDKQVKPMATRIVQTGSSYCAANEPRVHFGIDESETVTGAEVAWVDGTREWFAIDELNQHVTLQRGEGEVRE